RVDGVPAVRHEAASGAPTGARDRSDAAYPPYGRTIRITASGCRPCAPSRGSASTGPAGFGVADSQGTPSEMPGSPAGVWLIESTKGDLAMKKLFGNGRPLAIAVFAIGVVAVAIPAFGASSGGTSSGGNTSGSAS